MNRQEIKQMWLSLPHSNPIDEIKVIKVEKLGEKHWYVERITDTKDLWSTSGTNFRNMKDAIDHAHKLKNSSTHEGYELFIHGAT